VGIPGDPRGLGGRWSRVGRRWWGAGSVRIGEPPQVHGPGHDRYDHEGSVEQHGHARSMLMGSTLEPVPAVVERVPGGTENLQNNPDDQEHHPQGEEQLQGQNVAHHDQDQTKNDDGPLRSLEWWGRR
jgi:hypothetical protein